MVARITRKDISLAVWNTLVKGCGEPEHDLGEATRIYKDFHANEPIGKAYALDLMSLAVQSLGIDQREFITAQKPNESTDYTIRQITDMIATEAQRQGILTPQ